MKPFFQIFIYPQEILIKADEDTFILNLGTQHILSKYFKHNPPTPQELEYAIIPIEEEIISLQKNLPQKKQLIISDKNLYEFFQKKQVLIEEVEEAFTRLALMAQGRSAKEMGISENIEFYAKLLFLREFMHHLKFNFVLFENIPV